MFKFIEQYLLKKAVRRDREYKEAVHYAYQHYEGQELEDFLDIIDSIYDDTELVKRKRRLRK